MTLNEALESDILVVLPFGGRFLSVVDVTKAVAPLRAREVRATLNALVKRRVLDSLHGGGGWPSIYGRRSLKDQLRRV